MKISNREPGSSVTVDQRNERQAPSVQALHGLPGGHV